MQSSGSIGRTDAVVLFEPEGGHGWKPGRRRFSMTSAKFQARQAARRRWGIRSIYIRLLIADNQPVEVRTKRRLIIAGSVVATSIILAAVAVLVLVLVLRSIFTSGAPSACAGMGRPARLWIKPIWEERRVTSGEAVRTYSVSSVIEVPPKGRGIRVDAVVFGSRNAPIFPDAVSIDLVNNAQIDDALRQDLDLRTSSAPTTITAAAPLLVPVGFGVKAINENVAVAPGRYRLVTLGQSQIGDVDVRVCI